MAESCLLAWPLPRLPDDERTDVEAPADPTLAVAVALAPPAAIVIATTRTTLPLPLRLPGSLPPPAPPMRLSAKHGPQLRNVVSYALSAIAVAR